MKKLSIYSGIVILIFSLVFPGPYFGDVSAENEVNTGDTATVETGNSMTDIEKDETQSELEAGSGDIQDNSANVVDDSDNEFLLKNLNDFQPTSISLLGAGNDTNNEDLPDDTDRSIDSGEKWSLIRDGKTIPLDVNRDNSKEEILQAIIQADGNGQYSITHEPGNITYTDTNGKVFDGIGTITIKSGDQSITMLDRNLGATNVGTEGVNTFGYYFQWGNNYGFSYDDAINQKIETDTTFEEKPYAWNNPLVSSKLMRIPGWLRQVNNSYIYTFMGLWGNGNSKQKFQGIRKEDSTLGRCNPDIGDGVDCQYKVTDYKRQGPCPSGYHVPSRSEFEELMQMYSVVVRGIITDNEDFFGETILCSYDPYKQDNNKFFCGPLSDHSDNDTLAGLVSYYIAGSGLEAGERFKEILKIPDAGRIFVTGVANYNEYPERLSYLGPGNGFSLWTSSLHNGCYQQDCRSGVIGYIPNGLMIDTNQHRALYINENGLLTFDPAVTDFIADQAHAAPVRCFKDLPLNYSGTQSLVLQYETNGGSAIQSQTIPAGYSGYLPGYTTHKKGYNLVGWFNEDETIEYNLDDRGVTFTNLMMADELADNNRVVKVYAKWEKYAIVTFDYNGLEEAPTTREVSKGGTLSEPSPKPERFGYNFAGWYTDKGCKTKYDFNTKIESDITLYAKREPRKDYSGRSYTACDTAPGIVHDSNLTVNYTDPNGNNFKAGTITISDGQDCITMLDRNLGASEAGVGTGYSMPKVNGYDMDKWVQYYARYDSGYYGYKFQRGNNYGFKLGLKINPQSLDTDASTIKFSETPAIYNNYGPTKRYKNDTFRITYNENNMKNEDYWSSNQHYDNLRGGENDSAENGRGLYLDNDKERQGPCPSGYHVPSAGEWNKAIIIWANNHKNDNIHTSTTGYFGPFESHISVGEINKYDSIGKNSRMLFQEDLMLPSEWDIAKYDSRDALHYGNFQSKYYHGSYWTSTPGGRYEGLSNNLLIDVYNAGVYNGASFSDRSFAKNIRCFKNKQDEPTPDDPPTPTTYIVTFNSNGGSPTPASQIIEKGKTATKPQQDPTRSGYTFKYRYSTSSSTGYDFSSPVTKNITLYAKWETNSEGGGGGGGGGEGGGTTTPNTYTVYFDSNGGTSVPSSPVQDGDYVSEPPEPTRKGYTFLGRYTRTTGGREITFREKITNDTTYYAQWQENSYTIRYNLNGGNGSISSDTVDYSERIRLPSSPSRNGYTFDGWNTRSNGNGTHYNGGTYVSKLSDRDGDIITLYAQRTDSPNSDNNSNPESSNLSISLYNTKNPTTNEWIGVNIKTDTKYTGKISFGKLQYYSYDVSKWIDVPYSTKAYVYDYDDYIDDGFRLTTNDFGSMIIKNLIKFNKEGNYRIYISDKNGYETSLQLYVKPSENENIITNTGTTDIPQPIKNIQNILDGNDQKNQNNITLDTTDEVYIARSCKEYKIQYNSQLGVFTSPNLNKNEYFVNKEYFKRYIDSKNKWKQGCPTNGPRISTSYIEKSTDTDKYIAPNGKVYFITIQNGLYISKELNSQSQTFGSLSAIKYFIRDRNPLIKM